MTVDERPTGQLKAAAGRIDEWTPAAPAGIGLPVSPDAPVSGADSSGGRPRAGRLERLSSFLAPWQTRVAFGAAMGIGGLAVKLALNGMTDDDTGFAALYLFLVLSAASGGMVAALTTTVVSVAGQGYLFYEPVGSFAFGSTAEVVRLGLFAVTGTLVSFVTHGLLRARVRAERASDEVVRMYDVEAQARLDAEDAGRRSQVLFETAARLSSALTVDDVTEVVLRHAVRALGGTSAAVWLVTESGDELAHVERGDAPAANPDHAPLVALRDADAIAIAARSGLSVYTRAAGAGITGLPAPEDGSDPAGGTVAALPVIVQGRTIGVLAVRFGTSRTFSASERELHLTVARQFGQAIARARLYEAEQAARQAAQQAEVQASRLQDITAALAEARTPAAVAELIVRLGLGSLGASEGGVSLISADGTRVERVVAVGYPDPLAEQYRTYPIDSAIPAADALRRGAPIFLESPSEIAEAYPDLADAFAAAGAKAVAVLPFRVDGRVRGGVNVLFGEARHLTAAEREYMSALAHECGQALVRAMLREAEEQARAEAAASQAALGFLADAGDILSSSFDYESTLNRIAALAVRVLADRCSVDIRRDDGRIQRVATAFAHGDAANRWPAGTSGASSAGVEAVIATGRPILISRIDATTPDGSGPVPGGDDGVAHPATHPVLTTGDPGARSYMAVPLRRNDEPFGAITFVSETPGRFDEEALAVASELAARASAAVERALLFREATQFIATVDASLDAVFMFDPATLQFTYVNQGAVNQVGHTREELLAMSALAIKPDFDEAGYRDLMEPLLSGERPSVTFTTTHLHRDGTLVPVAVFLQGVRLPGGKVQMIVTARDIRQQLEVEANLYRLARAERSRAAELSAVIRGMGEAVLVCDASGRVILSNPAVVTILSTTVERYEDLISLFSSPAESMPRLGAAAGPLEVRLAGTDRWLDVSTYPVSLESGDLYGDAETTIIMLRDVTAARNARAAREAFIGVLSHELRTPITTIYGTTKLFGRASTSPEMMRSMLLDVEEEADRLYRLVEDLLILSRSESGIEVEGEPVLLQHIVRAVIAAESQRWPQTEFVAVVSGGLPPVSGDRTYLEQGIRNLLANAAKYSPPGTRVEVRATVEANNVVIRVLDSGPGFPAAEAPHLFELFYRSPATARKVTGAGIGLYVSKALIEAMGGRIWAIPRPEGGAEFGFTVPILEVELEPDELEEPVAVMDDAGASSASGRASP